MRPLIGCKYVHSPATALSGLQSHARSAFSHVVKHMTMIRFLLFICLSIALTPPFPFLLKLLFLACRFPRELRMELRSIRRASSAHVIASHSYCMKAGGPKMVFSAGADGLQVSPPPPPFSIGPAKGPKRPLANMTMHMLNDYLM